MRARTERTSAMQIASSRRVRAILAAIASVPLLAACGGLQIKPPPMAFYDLGAGNARVLRPALAPSRVEVNTRPWLALSAMQYRLLWQDPDRRRAYSESRWASQPAEMLALVLERSLGSGTGGLRCRLQMELDEFVQVFPSAGQSQVELLARIGLIPPRSDVPIAHHEFRIVEAAPTADAAGGVAGFRRASERLVTEVAEWITMLDQAPGEGLNGPTRCGA